MADTDVSDAPTSLCQDDAALVHFLGEYEDRLCYPQVDENRTDHEDSQLSTRSYTLSMIKHFFASFFVPRGAKATSVDSGLQALPSETTPLLVPPICRIEEPVDHESYGSNTPLSVLWIEVKTLVRYALPVFGFVYSASR